MLQNPHDDNGSWWSRPGGPREVLQVALPLIVTTAFWSLQWFIDRVFLMHYSTDAIAAALPAGMLQWTLVCFPMGVASYVTTFVAQYYGAQRPQRIGLAVAQGIRFGWVMTPLLLLAIPFAPMLTEWSAATEKVHQLQVEYFQYLTLGAGAVVLSNAMSSFYTGRGKTRIVMLVNVGGTLVNLILDYLLIFGEFGFPEMGIKGAAIATTVANWFNVVAFYLLMRRKEDRETYALTSGNRFDRTLMWRLLRFGAPSALPMLIEAGAITILVMAVGSIGVIEAAATSMAFNINAVAFVPVYGLGIAVSALVGQHLGADRDDLAARATHTSLAFAAIYTAVFGLLYVAAGDWFLLPFRTEENLEEFNQVRDVAVILLRFVAAYCLFDAVQVIFVGALRGAGDTRFVLYVTTLVSGGSVAIGALGQTFWGWRLYGWWWVMTGWIFSLAIIYTLRFSQGKWRSMRVIEPEVTADEDLLENEVVAGQMDA